MIEALSVLHFVLAAQSRRTMNIDLLETIRHDILFRPERFCAAQWAFARNGRRVKEQGDAPVGFKCCIAGHALLHGDGFDERALLRRGGFHDGEHLWQRAGDVLDLTKAQRDELFFPSQWDKPYKQDYYLCARDEEADIAAAYIDHFISKHAVPVDGPASWLPAHEQPDGTTAESIAVTVA
jgi:hypothetical protein